MKVTNNHELRLAMQGLEETVLDEHWTCQQTLEYLEEELGLVVHLNWEDIPIHNYIIYGDFENSDEYEADFLYDWSDEDDKNWFGQGWEARRKEMESRELTNVFYVQMPAEFKHY